MSGNFGPHLVWTLTDALPWQGLPAGKGAPLPAASQQLPLPQGVAALHEAEVAVCTQVCPDLQAARGEALPQ